MLTPKHHPQPEKPSLGLGKAKASVCHLGRNKLESETLEKEAPKERKQRGRDRDQARKEQLHNTKPQQAVPSLLLGLPRKLPAPNRSPAASMLEQAVGRRAQPCPPEPSRAGLLSRGRTVGGTQAVQEALRASRGRDGALAEAAVALGPLPAADPPPEVAPVPRHAPCVTQMSPLSPMPPLATWQLGLLPCQGARSHTGAPQSPSAGASGAVWLRNTLPGGLVGHAFPGRGDV